MRMIFRFGGQVVFFGLCLFCFSGCLSLPLTHLDEQIAATSPVDSVASFKENRSGEGETVSGQWWTLFHDEQLNGYVTDIASKNFTLKAGYARIEQACATLGVSMSELVPNVDNTSSVQRNRLSENDTNGRFGDSLYTQYRSAIGASWEVDLWGRIRSSIRGAKADVEETKLLTEDLKLSLQIQLARNYFTLRFLDEEIRVVRESLDTREQNVSLARKRFEGGLSNELDVSRAETELAVTRAELARLDGPRAQLEHAIAALLGIAPANFEIAARELDFRLPVVSPGVPASVLGNRPDVAAAVARLKSTSARIGVAKAQFYPSFNLIGTGGLSSISSEDFLSWSSRFFTVGPSVTTPIFQGGRLKANLKNARAQQAEALADYQQTMLDALREVEDALSDLAAFQREREAQLYALTAARKTVSLSTKRYQEGLVNSLEVIDAIRESLDAERRVVQLRSLQYDATVRLIEALGGGLTRDHCAK